LSKNQADPETLARELWPLCERLSARLKQASLAAGVITLKLKTADFRLRTRSRRIADPTQLADTLFHIASSLLAAEANGATWFRLVGIGADQLCGAEAADPPSLFEREFGAPRRLEHAIDEIRGKLGWGRSGSAAICRPMRGRMRTGRNPDSQQFGLESGSISSSLARIE
jgi:DNA polymerase IV